MTIKELNLAALRSVVNEVTVNILGKNVRLHEVDLGLSVECSLGDKDRIVLNIRGNLNPDDLVKLLEANG